MNKRQSGQGSRDGAGSKRTSHGAGRAKPRLRRIDKDFPEARGAIVGKMELRQRAKAKLKADVAAPEGVVGVDRKRFDNSLSKPLARSTPQIPLSRRRASGHPAEEMRVAKAIARAGLCSRRDAERWIEDGRVKVNGKTITTPAINVRPADTVLVDGQPLPDADLPRLWRYHKPRGLVTTHKDPEGRPTVFDELPDHIGRVISIGRLDYNSEGLLLLTNNGALARLLELPETAWLRRYRVRAHGNITQARLDALKDGIEVEGVQYGPIEAKLDSQQGANVWLTMGLREGKNREVRNVLAALGLTVNRLIRVSFGPFQLLDLEEGAVENVKRRVLVEQLGPQRAHEFGLASDANEENEKPDREPRRRRRRAPGARS